LPLNPPSVGRAILSAAAFRRLRRFVGPDAILRTDCQSVQPGAARPVRVGVALAALLLAALTLPACRQDMHDQPRFIPLRPSGFFDDGRSQRPLIEGTVPRGHLNDDLALYTGKDAAGKPLDTFPFPVTRDVVDRGQERFNVYCSPCHDRTGSGDGMVVRRGFRHPPSYHTGQIRSLANGFIFDVITNGFGAMPDYAAQISARDRWAIVAYVRALQLSQHASIADLPAEDRGKLGGAQ
jgi:mono/diheme cytochrome c family protein